MWVLSSGISGFAEALFSIGLVMCAIAAAMVWYHRVHPVIRSASPLFLLLSIAGVALLYGAGLLLVGPATASSCSAFSWLLNFGLQLCFAPLFAKTYRIYRIFGRKKLSVVQLSNKKLMLIVLAILALEALLLAIWQAVGPIAPLTTNVTDTALDTAGHNVINQYVQCGVPAGKSMSMFAVICVEKGILFVFGALMAFTTRKVSSTFNESQGISLSIYNVCFTIGIISPIIIVVSAVGDVLTLLQVFALLWIAYFTGTILFAPKLMTIYFHSNGSGDEVNNSVVAASSSSSSGYQFLSLKALSTLPMLQGYQASLRKHLEVVDARVAKLKHDKGTVGSTLQQRPSAKSALVNAPTSPPLGGRRDVGSEQSILGDRDRAGSGGAAAKQAGTARSGLTSPVLQIRSSAVVQAMGRSSMTSPGRGQQAAVEPSIKDDEHSQEQSDVVRDEMLVGDRLLLNRASTGD